MYSRMGDESSHFLRLIECFNEIVPLVQLRAFAVAKLKQIMCGGHQHLEKVRVPNGESHQIEKGLLLMRD